MMNLQCGATRLYRRNAVCRVACLAWAGWIGKWKHRSPRPGRLCWFPWNPGCKRG